MCRETQGVGFSFPRDWYSAREVSQFVWRWAVFWSESQTTAAVCNVHNKRVDLMYLFNED